MVSLGVKLASTPRDNVDCLAPLVEEFLQTPAGTRAVPVWMERTPVGRMLDVTDLQGAVVFLACPASDFMTGADLVIDGGYCAW